ncbi:MAG: integration host factor subunit beta [Chitinispirillia bacterium]|nr:integration host factor subunit beta [Chitinispirillia bacterium]MCL2240898.1 integration host factor subunit beta [Chitinispirillia bacterium]
MNTTKHGLIASVARATGLTQAEIRIAVEELLEVFAEELAKGRTIELRGFGTFYVRERKARPARNPKTGEVVPLDKRVVPLFKYSAELRKRISGGKAR